MQSDSAALQSDLAALASCGATKVGSLTMLWCWRIHEMHRQRSVMQHMSMARQPRMGADFLIDESGKIVDAYYGQVMGEHMPWPKVEAFASGAAGAGAPEVEGMER